MRKTVHYRGFAALVFFFLAACGGSQPALSPLPDDAVILAFGDSLTFGTGAQPGLSYPEVLQKLIGKKVVRSGIPGETSDQGLKRLPGVLESTNPDLVILCHGGNDLLRKMDPKGTENNLKAMIRMIKERGSGVVLIAVPKPGLMLSSAPLYREVAEEMHVPFDDDTLEDILSKGRFKSDYIHPNAQGYAQLAEAIAGLLRKHGAIP